MAEPLRPVRPAAVARPGGRLAPFRATRSLWGRRPLSTRPGGVMRRHGARTAIQMPPLPPPPLPVAVTRSASVARPTGSAPRAALSSRRSRRPLGVGLGGCLGPLAWLVAAGVSIFGVRAALVGLDHGARPEPGSQTTAQTAGPGASTRALAPIVLPAPTGSAPRVRPLQVEVIIAPEVMADAATATTVRGELPVLVNYMASYGIVGDGLTIGPGSPALLSTDHDRLAAAAATPVAVTAAAPDAVARAVADLAPFEQDDRAVIVLTEQPAVWSPLVPSAPAPDPALTPERRPAALRGLVVDIQPDSGATRSLPNGPHPYPQMLTADPTIRGAIAESLARAWVDSYGGEWPS